MQISFCPIVVGLKAVAENVSARADVPHVLPDACGGRLPGYWHKSPLTRFSKNGRPIPGKLTRPANNIFSTRIPRYRSRKAAVIVVNTLQKR